MISILYLFYKPWKFFSGKFEEMGFLPPLLVVVAFILLSAASSAFGLEGHSLSFTANWLLGFFGPFLGWLFIAATLYVFSDLLGGDVTFLKMLKVAGYGVLPLAIEGAMELILGILYRPAALAEILPFFSFSGTLFLAWSLYIWFYGVRKVADLNGWRTLLSVVFPLLLLFVRVFVLLKNIILFPS